MTVLNVCVAVNSFDLLCVQRIEEGSLLVILVNNAAVYISDAS